MAWRIRICSLPDQRRVTVVRPSDCLTRANATVFEVVTEVVFGRVSIRAAHLPYGALFGVGYIAFTWLHGPRLAASARRDDAEQRGGEQQGGGALLTKWRD